MLTLHASSIAFDGAAVLLRGPSGSGKSDLALRALADGAGLIADDVTHLLLEQGELIAAAPERIQGLLEVRGLGPVRVRAAQPTPVRLLLDLLPAAQVPRLPEPRFETFLGIAVPALAFAAFEASALLKLRIALERARAGKLFVPDEAEAAPAAKWGQAS